MKIKTCPKCGSTQVGEQWVKGRMLQQHCYIGDGDEFCGWKGEPYTPPKKRITNKTQLRIDEFSGWHYIVYDKYGHVHTDSATFDTKAEALGELQGDLIPKQGYDDPAAPLTAVLFNVPSHITIKGQMFRVKDGKLFTKK